MDTEQYLREIMGRYTVPNMGIKESYLFEEKINEFLNMTDESQYSDDEAGVQRDYSRVFSFGHNHDFGTFSVKGKMGDRHIKIIKYFIDYFGLPKNLKNTEVFDVGIWCGGTSLILDGMGAFVTGIEEVEMYAKCAGFLFKKLAPAATAYHLSLYDIEWEGIFNYIIFPGVLYHLSDPILGLRILFNALKDGGEIYIETATTEIGGDEPAIEYYGSQREGWNWFAPNSAALHNMLLDVGFTPYEKVIIENGRLFTKAKRGEWKPMVKAGLSRRVR